MKRDEFLLRAGPWYYEPPHRKAWLWLRYQPWFKVRMLAVWLHYLWDWHRTYKYYPPFRGGSDREMPDGSVAIPPQMMWEITVCQDADELRRYWLVK